MVAAVTKSKQLAARAPAGGPTLPVQKVDAVYLDFPAGRRDALATLLAALKVKFKPTVLVRLHEPREAMEALARELQPSTPVQLYVANRGDYVVPGRIGLMGDQAEDLVLDRGMSGFLELKPSAVATDATAGAPPSTRVLLASLAQTFGAGLVAALVAPGADADLGVLEPLVNGGAFGVIATVAAGDAPEGGPLVVPLSAIAELLGRG